LSRTSHLQEVLEGAHFAVTAECGPPKGADPQTLREKAQALKGYVDAVNVTDNQTAVVRLCSLASCAILKQMGLDPVLQMTTRDRNRIALQSDLLGASALGIGNVLCLSGDHVSFGSEPQALGVFDLDSIQLLYTARLMRDQGKFLGGEALSDPPRLFLGAVENPFADPLSFRAKRLAKKVAAGAQFIQTQCVYNLERFEEWMKQVRDLGLQEKTHILAGVTPLKSARMARYMKERVAGMDLPDPLLERMERTPAPKQREEGLRIALETIEALRNIPGVRGIHIMAIEWEEAVPVLVERSGMLPRPLT
jgi:methylenetetrahydrofolate reductase (NADPH)